MILLILDGTGIEHPDSEKAGMADKFYLVELREDRWEDHVLLGVYFTPEAAETGKKFLKKLYPSKDTIIWTRVEAEEWRSKNLFGRGIYGS